MHQIIANFASGIKITELINYPQKFSLPIKGLINTSRTLGKLLIRLYAFTKIYFTFNEILWVLKIK